MAVQNPRHSEMGSITARRWLSLRRTHALLSPASGLSEEQTTIYDLANDFGAKRLAPHMQTLDARQTDLPHDVLKEAASLGFGGIYVDPAHGGTGLSRLDASLIFEGLSRHDVSTTAYISIHNMVAFMIDAFGSEDIKQQFLPSLCTMDTLASYCLTEPASGSDAASLSTRATETADHYELNGSKAFISGAGQSHIYLVMARLANKGITCFLVERDTPGLSFGKKEQKLGWNSQPTRAVILEHCRVPKTHIVGSPGDGFKIAMKGLDGGRVNIASCSLGGAHASITDTIDYVKQRKQFNTPIIDFQNTQFRLAELSAQLIASRLMVRAAASRLDNRAPDATPHCAMAKMYATEACSSITDTW